LIVVDLCLLVPTAAQVNPYNGQPVLFRRFQQGRQFVLGNEIGVEEIRTDE